MLKADLDLIEEALVSGIRNFMEKAGFRSAHLGLSGGIDSALVAYLAVQAAGNENITGFILPSRYSSQHGKDDAAELAENLGIRYETISIESCYAAFLSTLEGIFKNKPFDVAEENIQARIRGTILMAYSNKFGSMLFATGNKSEISMGYCTLYGDTNGSLLPIGDLFKTEVYALSRRINERSLSQNGKVLIPLSTIEKAPSAELRPNQKDEDSLPPYEKLDEILSLYLHEKLSPDAIVKRGWEKGLVDGIINSVTRTEFKRQQLPPILKITYDPAG